MRKLKWPSPICQCPGEWTLASSMKARKPCRLSASTSSSMCPSRDPDEGDAPDLAIALSCVRVAWRVCLEEEYVQSEEKAVLTLLYTCLLVWM